MKSVKVTKKGFYYNPERKETLYLKVEVYELNDKFADLVVREKGGDYSDAKSKKVKEPQKQEPNHLADDSAVDDSDELDYSNYDLTNGARKLAVEQKVSYDFLDGVEGKGSNGRISKDDLEDALKENLDGSEK